MKDRIKEVRRLTGLTQAKFGEMLGVSLMAVQNWEMGKNNPSSTTLQLISQRAGVSEHWLRTGEGEMLIARTREEELIDFVSRCFEDQSLDFQRRLLSVLCRLPAEDWSVLEKIADEIEKEG